MAVTARETVTIAFRELSALYDTKTAALRLEEITYGVSSLFVTLSFTVPNDDSPPAIVQALASPHKRVKRIYK